MSDSTDVLLVGGGIMSATLGALLKQLDPGCRVQVFERLGRAAAESSDAWNNAGTGHSGFCELNYTPDPNDVSKAVRIAEQYELSKQFWTSLVERRALTDLDSFVRPVPHLAFVRGEDDVAFLRTRHANLLKSPLFEGMELSADAAHIAEWAPLMMEGGREGPTGRQEWQQHSPVAATRMAAGTDVNFGALTRALLQPLEVHCAHEVLELQREGENWRVDVRDLQKDEQRSVRARFVFIGAGGYSLTLLEKSGIPEAKGYGAFPVSGQWLRCTNEDVIARHHAKVYGKAEVGAPPMSVPHLDTRWIDGKRQLLFGPYAGVTTKFLKEGSWLDLLRSIGIENVLPVVRAGLSNLDLTAYLIGQAVLAPEDRLELLKRFYPGARPDDWELQIAGLRVQVIQSDGSGKGVLKFGTEVVTSADGSIAALLGASPGASTAVAIMLELLERCFPEQWKSWRGRCAELMPSLGRPLHGDPALCRQLRAKWSAATRS